MLSENVPPDAVSSAPLSSEPGKATLPGAITNKTKSIGWRRVTRWLIHHGLNLALALIGLGALWIYHGQLVQMRIATQAAKQAADAAKDSADLAGQSFKFNVDEFHAEQRPILWLTDDVGSPAFVPNPLLPNSGQVTWRWRFTNYGKTPVKGMKYLQFMKLGEGPFVPSYGAVGASTGSPIPPGKIDESEVVSKPITPGQFQKLLHALEPNGISISIRIEYTDAYGGNYETGICLHKLNMGGIAYCKTGNYIN